MRAGDAAGQVLYRARRRELPRLSVARGAGAGAGGSVPDNTRGAKCRAADVRVAAEPRAGGRQCRAAPRGHAGPRTAGRGTAHLVQAVKERIRIAEYMKDFDKLSSGRITVDCFYRGLQSAHVQLSRSDFDALAAAFDV